MKTIEVRNSVFIDMARAIQVGPEQLECHSCGKIVAGLLPNGEENNFIYGVSLNHHRIIFGVHEKVTYSPSEDIICFCESCSKIIAQKIPEIRNAHDSPDPINGGHFITLSSLDKENMVLYTSIFQGDVSDFKRILQVLKN